MAPPAPVPTAISCVEQLRFDRQAVVVKTHSGSSGVFEHIAAQYRAASLQDDTWALVDGTPGPVDVSCSSGFSGFLVHNSSDVARYFNYHFHSLFHHEPPLILLHTALKRAFQKQYPHYWLQEDDAYFNGPPKKFFAMYAHTSTDYVGGDVPELAARAARRDISFAMVDRAGDVDRRDVRSAWHWSRGSVYPALRVVKREFIERYSAGYLNALEVLFRMRIYVHGEATASFCAMWSWCTMAPVRLLPNQSFSCAHCAAWSAWPY